jgi:hypothetical protein
MQSRRNSALEAITNVGVGYIAAVLSQLAIFPIVGIEVSFSVNMAVGAWFTGVSVIRSYALRRMFARCQEDR